MSCRGSPATQIKIPRRFRTGGPANPREWLRTNRNRDQPRNKIISEPFPDVKLNFAFFREKCIYIVGVKQTGEGIENSQAPDADAGSIYNFGDIFGLFCAAMHSDDIEILGTFGLTGMNHALHFTAHFEHLRK